MSVELVKVFVAAFYSGLAVLGAIAVFFGSIGEVSYDKLHVKANPLTMNVLGGSLLICGIVIYVWEKRRTGDRPVPSVSDYEVRIITPMNGAHIGVMDFAGTLKKALPDGYKLQLIRRWPQYPDVYYPMQEASIHSDLTWTAPKCNIYGLKDDARIVEAWFVGPNAQALFSTWSTGYRAHWELKQKLEGSKSLFPGIRATTSDMVKCAQITVYVRRD